MSEEDRNKSSPLAESESIQNQKSMLVNYAVTKGWEIYQIYCDEDYAGSDRSRPEFNRLLKDAEDKKFDIVLCKTQSRFTRELEVVEKYIHGRFLEWQIRFVSIVDNADTEMRGNKKARQINGLINEWYLEDLSDNIRSVLTNKRQEGQHIGSYALYGYAKDPEKKNHLIIDTEAAEVVRLIFSLYLGGMGSTAIARYLNDKKILSPAAYKRENGFKYQSPKGNQSLWSYTAVVATLKNQMYTGDMVQGKLEKVSYKSSKNRRTPKERWIVVPNTHESIIDRQTWQKAQELLCQRSKPCKSGEAHVFSGKVRCMYCGAALRSTMGRGKRYLFCRTKALSSESCPGCSIPYDILVNSVLEKVNAFSEEYYEADMIKQGVSLGPKHKNQKEQIEKIKIKNQTKKETLVCAFKELYVDKANGMISGTEYIELASQLREEKKRIEKEIESLQQRLLEYNKEKSEIDIEHSIKELKHISILTREMVLELIEEIHVGKKENNFYPIEIIWKFPSVL